MIGIKPTLLPNDFNNDMMLIIMILSILLSNPPLCLVLNIVVSCGWFICQLDVNNVFFQGYLFENVFMVQPLGFIDCDYPLIMCAKFANLSMVSSKSHVFVIMSFVNFL